jgi:hypothetical protein
MWYCWLEYYENRQNSLITYVLVSACIAKTSVPLQAIVFYAHGKSCNFLGFAVLWAGRGVAAG